MKSLKRDIILLLFALFCISSFGQEAEGLFNMLEHGADNSGQHLNTKIIAKVIAKAEKQGGGTLYFPPGTYLTGPIHLKSNITLHIEGGATLKFSDNFDDYYPFVQSRWEGTDVINFSPLIYGYEAKNIAIVGRGRLDGQGRKWWDYHHILYSKPEDFKSKWQKDFHKKNRDINKPDISIMIDRGFLRPPFIQPMFCENVRIEGVTIVNSPFWTINPEYCNNVTITGVTVNNPDSPNTDGINPESCSNVHISDCHISVGDDCITIKSGKDEDGRNRGVACENITITNCTMLEGHGGVVIGSEMSGDVKKVTISNCVFVGTDRGIRIKSARGRGGVVEDIRVSNIIFKNLKKEAIKLNMYYQKSELEPVSERTPVFRNIHFSGITGSAKQAGYLLGLTEMPIHSISFSDMNIKSEKGFYVEDGENIQFDNVELVVKDESAFEIVNSKNIRLNNVRNQSSGIKYTVIDLKNSKNVAVTNVFQTQKADNFMKISGEQTENIFFRNNILLDVNRKIEISEDVNKNEIITDEINY